MLCMRHSIVLNNIKRDERYNHFFSLYFVCIIQKFGIISGSLKIMLFGN